MNIKSHYLTIPFVMIVCGVFTPHFARAQGVGDGAVAVDPAISEGARAAVQQLGVELIKGNSQYGIDRMYPRWKRRLAKRYGGMDKLEAAFSKAAQQQMKMQMRVVNYQVGRPTAFFSVWKAKKINNKTGRIFIDATGREVIVSHWLAVVPTTVRVRLPDPQTRKIREVEESSYTLAISEKGSSNWYFMTGLKPTIQDLRSLFPSLPSNARDLGLPVSKAREIK